MALRKNRIIATVGFLAIAASIPALAQIRMFAPTKASAGASSPAAPQTASVVQGKAARFVTIDTTALASMRTGDAAIITTPGDVDFAVTYDRTDIGYGGGRVWVGHLTDLGRDYPVIISTFQGRVNGDITLPGNKLRLEGTEDTAMLTDVHGSGEVEFVPTRDDTVRAPKDPLADVEQVLGIPSATVQASGTNAQVDLLFLYSPNLATKLGGFPGVVTRANTLVSLANTIYTNSGMPQTLNLVEVQLLNTAYADLGDNTALDDVTNDASVQALRTLYGADLVTLVRPFVASVCGLAWIPGDFGSFGSNYSYSVVEDGSNGNAFCDTSSMTHELGHNMGSAHDNFTDVTFGNSNAGTPGYNRGYCNGSAGTIMSYGLSGGGCNPIVNKFSTPLISCNGPPCGIDKNTAFTPIGTSTPVTGADSVSAINTNILSIAGWRTGATKYVSVTPGRVLDSRASGTTTDGLYAAGGALGPGGQVDMWLTGRGGVPMNNVGSVVLTVTVTAPTGNGFLTVWPTGSTRPTASNLNFVPGQTISNVVIAKPGTNGYISFFNSKAGTSQVIADVAGWFPSASGFTGITPARLIDTRTGTLTVDGQFQGTGHLAAKTETDLTVLGRGGVPASGVKAVVMNVTATGEDAAGFLTAWPAGSTRPTASNINFAAATTIPNLVVAGVGTGGKVALFNNVGADIIADVAGYFSTSSELNIVGPARLIDTRPGSTTIDGQFLGAGALGAQGQVDLTVAGRGGVPASGAGTVVLNVTAVTPTATGFLTVWPSGTTRPISANVNFSPQQIISDLVFAKVGTNGKVTIFNNAGATHVVADVVGWLPVSP